MLRRIIKSAAHHRPWPLHSRAASRGCGLRWMSADRIEVHDVASETSAAAEDKPSLKMAVEDGIAGEEGQAADFQKMMDDIEADSEEAVVLPEATEKVVEGGKTSTQSFQAETTQLLDIVTNALYTDKEVFLRELISNASDAMEKARHMQVTGADMEDADMDLTINILTDSEAGTITIQDAGTGMTAEEMGENLGTIARSGTKNFAKAAEASSSDTKSNLIGQFGVGFYASFMVADRVQVFSKSATPNQPAHCWSSEGVGNYSVAEAEGVKRGTKIVLHLSEDSKKFATTAAVEAVIKKYSNFVNYPIHLNGEKVNTVQAIWSMGKNEVTEDQHNEFYRFVANAYDEPMYNLHFSADAPIAVKALFYVGQSHSEKYGMGRMEPNIGLYSRKVLIDSKSEMLPDWMRFVHGVVDSEDIPLNIAREGMQDSALIKRISNVLTKRMLKFLSDEAKKDGEEYGKFFDEYGQFLKEGVCSDFENKNAIANLLRFESSKLPTGEVTSLDEYISRCEPSQKNVYYLTAPDRKLAEASAYYEVFKKNNAEVLFMYQPIDDFVMTNLQEFNGRQLVTCESAKIEDIRAVTDAAADGDGDSTEKADGDEKTAAKGSQDALPEEDATALTEWMKEALAENVSDVKVTDRLYDSPAIVTDHESGALRRMMKMVEHQQSRSGGGPMSFMPKQTLEINPAHPIVVELARVRNENPALATLVAEQLFDNALVTAGLMDDSRAMLPRLQKLMEASLTNKSA